MCMVLMVPEVVLEVLEIVLEVPGVVMMLATISGRTR